MLIGSYFKKRRLEKGLSEAEVAAMIGPHIQQSEFWDFESGDDSDIDGFSIEDFKKYCQVLGINPTEYAEIPVSDIEELPLSLLVKTRREELGYSIQDLADYIGYEESVIHAIEEERKDTVVVLDVIKQLALVLGIPFRKLLEKL